MPADLNDEKRIERRLTCEHGTGWRKVRSSLSRVWCPKCEDMVECEFRRLDGTPIDP